MLAILGGDKHYSVWWCECKGNSLSRGHRTKDESCRRRHVRGAIPSVAGLANSVRPGVATGELSCMLATQAAVKMEAIESLACDSQW
jgi:hypothetical protein